MLDHLQEFSICKIWKKHSSETKEMLDKLCAEHPGTERLGGIVAGIDDWEKNEGVTKSIKNVEASR
jgi:hypothetical protein